MDNNSIADGILPNILGSDQLRMPIVNNLINNLINEDEVFPDGFLIEGAAVVSENFHHPVDDVHHETWGHVVLGSGHEVDAELFREKIVEALDILQNSKIKLDLRMRVGGRRPTGSLSGRKPRTFLSRGLVGL